MYILTYLHSSKLELYTGLFKSTGTFLTFFLNLLYKNFSVSHLDVAPLIIMDIALCLCIFFM